MDPTRIIAIRHGETPWNADARIQGQRDVDLNDTGRWQAQRVVRALAEEPITAVYSSDLSRAQSTAKPLAQTKGIPVIPHEGLRERSFGKFEGMTFDQIHQEWPDLAQRWRSRVPDWQPPEGGESLFELRQRCARSGHSWWISSKVMPSNLPKLRSRRPSCGMTGMPLVSASGLAVDCARDRSLE